MAQNVDFFDKIYKSLNLISGEVAKQSDNFEVRLNELKNSEEKKMTVRKLLEFFMAVLLDMTASTTKKEDDILANIKKSLWEFISNSNLIYKQDWFQESIYFFISGKSFALEDEKSLEWAKVISSSISSLAILEFDTNSDDMKVALKKILDFYVFITRENSITALDVQIADSISLNLYNSDTNSYPLKKDEILNIINGSRSEKKLVSSQLQKDELSNLQKTIQECKSELKKSKDKVESLNNDNDLLQKANVTNVSKTRLYERILEESDPKLQKYAKETIDDLSSNDSLNLDAVDDLDLNNMPPISIKAFPKLNMLMNSKNWLL